MACAGIDLQNSGISDHLGENTILNSSDGKYCLLIQVEFFILETYYLVVPFLFALGNISPGCWVLPPIVSSCHRMQVGHRAATLPRSTAFKADRVAAPSIAVSNETLGSGGGGGGGGGLEKTAPSYRSPSETAVPSGTRINPSLDLPPRSVEIRLGW